MMMEAKASVSDQKDQCRQPYISKTAETSCELFQTFRQTLKGPLEVLAGIVPKRSILRSPFMSIGIGCASEEEAANTEFGAYDWAQLTNQEILD